MTVYTIAARLSGSRTFRAVIGAVPVHSHELAAAQLDALAVEAGTLAELAVIELGTTELRGYPVELTEWAGELRVPAHAAMAALIANAPSHTAGQLDTIDPGELNACPDPETDAAELAGVLVGANGLVVIPCGGSKLDHAAPAAELYTGSYFRACLAYARAVTQGDDSRVRILSARYGFVALDRELAPYEQRMDEPGAITRAALVAQAWDHGLIGDDGHVILVGGRAYVEAGLAVWPGARTPLAGLAGMGYQLAELARLTRAASARVSVTA